MNNLGANDRITPRQIEFYRDRARGGCAFVITEGLAVHQTGIPNETVPLAFDRGLIPGFRRLAKAVHAEGVPIIGQLWHAGRQALWNPALRPWAPSTGRDPFSGVTPHAMTEVEIAEVMRAFSTSAANLKEAGFDGIELHGAHGYLLTQFLSPWSNQRSDQWGGSTENRARLLVDLIRQIRRVCGAAFVIGVKLSVHEYVDGGLDLAESQRIVAHVVGTTPPDYIAVSQANFSPSLERHVPDMRFPDAPFVSLARGVREVARGIPVMALAKIPDVESAEAILRDGVADLVGMSRPFLADAHLVTKARLGAAPRPCVYCNVCWQLIHTHRQIRCVYAPDAEPPRQPRAGRHRRIRVIGAGPAGLEVARVAAGRGHTVVVYEAAERTGGRLAWEADIPGRQTVGRAVTWLESEARRAGAEFRLATRIDAAAVASWDPTDLVIVATGSEPIVEPVAGAVAVVSMEEALAQGDRLRGPIAVVDEIEDEPVYAFAETLRAAGHEVSIVSRFLHVGRRTAYVSLIGVLRRLEDLGIGVHTLAVPVRILGGELIVRHPFSGRERSSGAAATVVRAGPYRSRALAIGGRRDVTTIGDASSPRPLVAIFTEAYETACAL